MTLYIDVARVIDDSGHIKYYCLLVTAQFGVTSGTTCPPDTAMVSPAAM